jgi:hypothetical protein
MRSHGDQRMVPHDSQLMDGMEISSTYEITPHGNVLLVTHGIFLLVTWRVMNQ